MPHVPPLTPCGNSCCGGGGGGMTECMYVKKLHIHKAINLWIKLDIYVYVIICGDFQTDLKIALILILVPTPERYPYFGKP